MFPKETDIGTESAEGYSVGQVLQAAVTATDCLDNKTIIDWLHANKVQTIQGLIGWDAVGRPNGSYLLEQYQNGKLARRGAGRRPEQGRRSAVPEAQLVGPSSARRTPPRSASRVPPGMALRRAAQHTRGDCTLNWDLLLQAIVLGILTGGVYALMASGLTLIFGIMRVVNVAHAAMIVTAAYVSWLLYTTYGLDPIVSIVIVMPVFFVGGAVAQRVVLRRLGGRDVTLSVLVAFGIAIILEGLQGGPVLVVVPGDQDLVLAEQLRDRRRLRPAHPRALGGRGAADPGRAVRPPHAQQAGPRDPGDDAGPADGGTRGRQRRPRDDARVRDRRRARGGRRARCSGCCSPSTRRPTGSGSASCSRSSSSAAWAA